MSDFSNVDNTVLYLVEGDTLSHYANLDTLESSANFASWRLDLLNGSDRSIFLSNIATINQDIISGSDYRFYFSFTVPSGLTDGSDYWLAIIDTADSDQVVYVWDFLEGRSSKAGTRKIKYRNDKNILNYNYEDNPSFYNEYRISITAFGQQNPVVLTGYEKVNGSFQSVRATKGINKRYVTIAYNEQDHEAFSNAIIHNDFNIYEDGSYREYSKGQEAYTVDWLDEYPLGHGDVILERTDSFVSSKLI